MTPEEMKGARKRAMDDLRRLCTHRPHPNALWQSIIDASDAELLDGAEPIPPLTEFMLRHKGTQPIPDATFALTICTAVEQALELAICTHFVLDDEGCQRMFDEGANAPLAMFAAKIRVGEALGIYPRAVRDELDAIRLIRNAFAHSWEQVSFATPAVVAGCNSLRIPETMPSLVQMTVTVPKRRFLMSARQLYVYLEWDSRAHEGRPMLFETHPGRSWFGALGAATAPQSQRQSP